MDSTSKLRHLAPAAGVLAAALAASAPAHAILCKELPSPVYGIGGSAPKPVFAKLGTALTKASPPETIVYQYPGACHGANALIFGTKMTGTASYWDAAGKEQSCDLELVGDDADFGIGGTYATQCPGISSLPPDVGDFIGPVQPYTFVVPKASSQVSISAAAAYFVYGFGATGQAEPWTDESQIITRDPNSGAAIIVALATGVPVAKLKGVDAKTNGNTVTLVSTSPTPEKAIGFCSGETADANLGVINILAYQHFGQTCGYWPSSTPTSFDKRNVRDGHYALWAPLHVFAKVDGTGKPTNPAAAKVVGYLTTGEGAPAGVDPLALEIQGGAIPDCAMEVKRSSDMGPIESYAPDAPCGCFFESVATGATSCEACGSDAECPVNAPNCRYGFCEVN
jgi:hypothetical protein